MSPTRHYKDTCVDIFDLTVCSIGTSEGYCECNVGYLKLLVVCTATSTLGYS